VVPAAAAAAHVPARGPPAGAVRAPARPPFRRWLDDDDREHPRARGRQRLRERSPDDRDGDDGDAYLHDRDRTPSPASRLAHWDFPREVLRALDQAGGVSCHHYVSNIRFRDNRTRNECLQLALFVDAYLAMDVNGVALPYDSELLDLMCRRLIGVLNADEHGNWSLATASQRSGASRMAGSELFAQLSRAANAYDRLQRAVHKAHSTDDARTGQKGRPKARGSRGSGRSKAGNSPRAPAAAGQSAAAARGAAKSG
jgi:hypothetical protein